MRDAAPGASGVGGVGYLLHRLLDVGVLLEQRLVGEHCRVGARVGVVGGLPRELDGDAP